MGLSRMVLRGASALHSLLRNLIPRLLQNCSSTSRGGYRRDARARSSRRARDSAERRCTIMTPEIVARDAAVKTVRCSNKKVIPPGRTTRGASANAERESTQAAPQRGQARPKRGPGGNRGEDRRRPRKEPRAREPRAAPDKQAQAKAPQGAALQERCTRNPEYKISTASEVLEYQQY
jgi:hypothetical protein